jgi:hypothetical protein
MSILDVSVSRFKNYDTPANPQTINLMDWLTSKEYAPQVQEIRTIDDKDRRDQLKAILPAITPSGTFTYRKEKNLIQHSGLIQFDVDFKENKHIKNYKDLKRHLCNLANVAYCGLSVSGRGYWGLVPIKHPDNHKGQYYALEKSFNNLGLILDPLPKSVASLRGYSYDPDGFFNHTAKVFEHVADPPDKQKNDRKPYRQTARTHFGNDIKSDVESLVAQIQKNRIDITSGGELHEKDYLQWGKIAFAFADEFGESGRDYFHVVSQYYPGYDLGETDRRYTGCLKSNNGKVSIKTFFHICALRGLHPERSTTNREARDRASQGQIEASPPTLRNGYPLEWDSIDPPEPGSIEYVEMIRAEFNEMGISHSRQIQNEAESAQGVVGHINA